MVSSSLRLFEISVSVYRKKKERSVKNPEEVGEGGRGEGDAAAFRHAATILHHLHIICVTTVTVIGSKSDGSSS